MTRAGVILGTAACMSPEQAKGKPVDKRTDIWAFGCILYECLTGRRAFEGGTVTETLAKILEGVPKLDLLPDSTPAFARSLLRRCLSKDPRTRLRDIADARIEIDQCLAREKEECERLPPTQAASSMRMILLAAAALAAGALIATLWFSLRTGKEGGASDSLPRYVELMSRVPILPGSLSPPLAITDEGDQIVYWGRVGGNPSQLFICKSVSREGIPVRRVRCPRCSA